MTVESIGAVYPYGRTRTNRTMVEFAVKQIIRSARLDCPKYIIDSNGIRRVGTPDYLALTH